MVELIVSIVILSVVGLFSFQFFTSGMETYVIIQKQKDLFDDGKLCLERMSREIRDAEDITAFTADTSIQIEKSHNTSDPATNITFTYGAASDDILRESGSSNVLANNVTSFFMTNTFNEIRIIIVLSNAAGNSVTMGTRCFPRNLNNPPAGFKSFSGNWREVVN